MIKRWTFFCSIMLTLHATGFAQANTPLLWHGFKKDTFSLEGRNAYIVQPPHAFAGNPWVWQAYFPDWHYEMDSILVSKGFHIAFIDCSDMFGSPQAMQLWDKFYQHVTGKYSFSTMPVLEGVSHGGLYAYGWAKRNPDKVSFIYAEAPVLDIKSWPGGKGIGRGSAEDWEKCLATFHLTEQQALDFKDNPIDDVASLAAYKIPAVHVVCKDDSIVPVAENTAVLDAEIRLLGDSIQIDYMTENISLQGHHFNITHPQHYAELVIKNVVPVRQKISSSTFIELNKSLNNTISKIKNKKELTVAFLGGSITYNQGWRNKLSQYLEETYPQCKFHFIVAGIPSLGSLPHSFRFKTDVLDKGNIDLLFIEAAVNDLANETAPAIQRRAMEGIIRNALTANPSINIVLMAFADEAKNKDYEKNTEPVEVKVHRQLAEYYGLPFINLAKEVYERIKAGEFTWKDDFKDLHPSAFGQNIYFQSIKTMLQLADKKYDGKGLLTAAIKRPKNKFPYDNGKYVPVNQATNLKGFSIIDPWAPADHKETREGFVHIPVLESTSAGSSFSFSFEGNAMGIAIVSGPDAGIISYRVDNQNFKTLNLYSKWSNYLHLPWYLILADGLKNGKHVVEVKTLPGKNDSGGSACRIVHFLVNQ